MAETLCQPGARRPRGRCETSSVAETERRTSSVELFWDLVFVSAVTQVTTLLSRHLSWAGFGRAMLILAIVAQRGHQLA
jgi:low temperature requirement protein LtrA